MLAVEEDQISTFHISLAGALKVVKHVAYSVCAYMFIHGILPPSPNNIFTSSQRLPGLLHEIEKQTELAGDKVRVVCITGPGADVYDIEGLVEKIADGRELGEYKGWRGG